MIRIFLYCIAAALLFGVVLTAIVSCNLGSLKLGYMGASLEFDFQEELHEVPHDLEHDLYKLDLTPAGEKIYEQIAATVDASTEDIDGTPKRYVLFADHPYLLVDTTHRMVFIPFGYVYQQDAGPGVGQNYEKE